VARKSTTHLIYALWSPSGKAYIGLTGTSLAKRWQGHLSRAKRAATGNEHPLVAAIRKYGPEGFRLEVLQDGLTAEEAAGAEQDWIAVLGARVPHGYNVSEGGENNVEAGVQRLRQLMRDPDWRQVYLAKLQAACRLRGVLPSLSEAALRWRAENPREAWKQSYRSARAALRGRRKAEDPRFGAWGRLNITSERVASARRGYFAKGIVAGVWAGRSTEEKRRMGRKIAASLTSHHAANPDAIRKTLAETRKKIDRSVQGPRASAGLKKWWSDLRADPDRYAAHMAQRAATRKARHAG
jgi:hypothetical protein